jgi:SAM-dependent methyltransferase
MRIYGRLAELLVARSPVDLRDRDVLDLGAGTGAASRAAGARGARRVVAVDRALGMLQADRGARPPAAVGDALALPFASRAFDVVVAAFSLNHLTDPTAGVREAGRVARRCLLASTYAADDGHAVKGAVERALAECGWIPPPWYTETKAAMAAWGTIDDVTLSIERGGLVPVHVEAVRVPFPDLAPVDLVRWRLGMAYCASFVAEHDAGVIERRALELLPDDAGPLVRTVIFLAAAAR